MRLQRLTPSSQVSEWAGNGDTSLDIPSRGGPGDYGWVQEVDDPLTSLSTVAYGTAGTWSVNTYVQAVVVNGGGAGRGRSTTAMAASKAGYLVECEVEIPSGAFSSDDDFVGIGFLESDISDGLLGTIRGSGSTTLLREGVVWGTGTAYTVPSAGTWVKLRVAWIPSTSTFTIWCDGTQNHSGTQTGSYRSGMRPTVFAFTNDATMTFRFRNLKSWYRETTTILGYPA